MSLRLPPDVVASIDGRAGPSFGSPSRPGLEPNATLVARIDLTSTIGRFVVRPDDGVGPFEPGQYFALGLTADGRPLQRPYSTSSSPGSRIELEFLVRLVPDGAFTPRLWARRVGDRLRIGRAKGLFTLRSGDPRTHLFVATGTGLAPFLSMVASLIRDSEGSHRASVPATVSPRAIVIHGVSHVNELAYRDRLERLAAGRVDLRYVPVVSRPTDPSNVGWAGRTGRLDGVLKPICDMNRLEAASTIAYLCGNPDVVAAAERILVERGLDREAIVSERYWPARDRSAPTTRGTAIATPAIEPEPQACSLPTGHEDAQRQAVRLSPTLRTLVSVGR
jgi:ferredoxin-NADP reductase